MTEKEPEIISTPAVSDKAIAAWEIVSAVSSFLIAEWLALALVGSGRLIAIVPVILVFALMLVSQRQRGEGLREIGIRFDNLARAVAAVAAPTLIAGLAIIVTGWFAGSLRLGSVGSRPRYLLLPVWAFAQQYIMQGFINRRAQLVCGNGWQSILIVAALFGLLHLPNANLALLTFAGGIVWAAIYQRVPNLFALALSHSILAALVALSFPPSWLNSLRVGFKYFG